MMTLSYLLQSVIEPWRKAPSWGARPRMPDCNLPSVDQSKSAARAGSFFLNRATGEETMIKIYQLKTAPKEALGVETYLAPPPPFQGKIIGLDCHPDTFTAAVFVGQTPHEARKVGGRENLGLQALLGWAAKEFGAQDLFVLEAGSNSFELCTRLHALGLRAVVLESCHVGKHAKTYADNDKMAAARIALVFLAGNAPCVWVPDERSRQRRELLHAYRKAVEDHTAAGNSLRAYLNGNAIRPAKGNLELESTRQWILKQRDWSPLQSEILAEHFGDLDACKERRKRLYRLIAAQMSAQPMMLRSMKVLGVGLINAFALLARYWRCAPLPAARKTRRLHWAQPRPAPKRDGQEHQTRRG